MSDIYLDALQKYLNGQEWRQSIEMFVSANCSLYADIEDMSHKQYEMWKTFQEIVENILEMALQCVGGSISSLEKELARIVKYKEPKGPRDEMIKDVLERLLSFDDFRSFAEMMYREYQSQSEAFIHGGYNHHSNSTTEVQHAVNEEHYNILYQMGYEEDDIYNVMLEMPVDASLEDLVLKMSAGGYNCVSPSKFGNSQQEQRYSPAKGSNYDRYVTNASNSTSINNNGGSSSSNNVHYNQNNSSDVDYVYNPADFADSDKKDTYGDDEYDTRNEGKSGHSNPYAVTDEDEGEQWETLPEEILQHDPDGDGTIGVPRVPQYLAAFAVELELYYEDIYDSSKAAAGANNGSSGSSSNSGAQSSPLSATAVDVHELHAKFVMAESVLDTFDSASSESSVGVVRLLAWARDMCSLLSDVKAADTQGVDFHSYTEHYPTGLVHWYIDLEATRKDFDESSVGGNIISDSEIQRMVELDNIAALGTEDEQLLHSLISRHDACIKDIRALHYKLSLSIAKNRNVQRETIEELYLFLKQQVANNIELDLIVDDLYEYIHNIMSGSKGIELVNLLLDLHILEDEQFMLKKKIQALVGDTGSGSSADAAAAGSPFRNDAIDGINIDTSANTMRGTESKLGLINPMSPGDVGLDFLEYTSVIGTPVKSHADAKSSYNRAGDDEFDQGLCGQSPVTLSQSRGDVVGASDHSDAKQHGSVKEFRNIVGYTSDEGSGGIHPDAKADSKHNGSVNGATNSSQNIPGIPQFDNDAYLASLKAQHKNALGSLKSILEAEKNKRLKDLEDKLLRRKLKIKSSVANDQSNDKSPSEMEEEEAFLEIQRQEIESLERDIESTTDKYNKMISTMCSGYKKKCLAELKAVRQHAVSRGLAVCVPLSDADKSNANKDIANQLISRFERDTKSLLESIEHDRLMQRNKLLLALSKRKAEYRDGSGSDTNNKMLQRLEDKTSADIERLNNNTNEQVASILQETHSNILNTLSAIYIEDSTVLPQNTVHKKKGSGGASKHNDDDDDDEVGGYLSDSDGHRHNKLGVAWLSRVGDLQDTYLQASKQIQYKLSSLHNNMTQEYDVECTNKLKTAGHNELQQVVTSLESAVATDNSESTTDSGANGDPTFATVTTHMLRVITDAFAHQLEDDDTLHNLSTGGGHSANLLPTSASGKKRDKLKKEDNSRVKAGILEEFERTRDELNHSLQSAHAIAMNKLANRRKQTSNLKNGGEGKEGDYELLTVDSSTVLDVDVFEHAIDTFLDDPLVSESKYKADTAAELKTLAKKRETAKSRYEHSYHSGGDGHDAGVNEQDRERIRNKHSEKEKVLEEDLYANMLSKKKKLEDRLRKKREESKHIESSHGASAGGSGHSFDDDQRLEEEATMKSVKALEQAFENVSRMLKTASKDEVNALNLKQLIDMMEESARDTSKSGSPVKEINMLLEDEEDAQGKERDDNFDGSNSNNSKNKGSSIHSTIYKYPTIDRKEIESEARRISYSYNEENAKHDLMMKIQETRQKQALQRKLLERRMNAQQNITSVNAPLSPLNAHKGSGYSSSMTMQDIKNMRPLGNLQPSPDLIGPHRPGIIKQPSNLQPVFKGVDAETIVKNDLNKQKSFQSRGLNLGPMFRK